MRRRRRPVAVHDVDNELRLLLGAFLIRIGTRSGGVGDDDGRHY